MSPKVAQGYRRREPPATEAIEGEAAVDEVPWSREGNIFAPIVEGLEPSTIPQHLSGAMTLGERPSRSTADERE